MRAPSGGESEERLSGGNTTVVVRIGDTVTVSVEVIGVREEKRLLTLRTDCTNQDGVLVLTGEATVKYVGEA